MTDKAIQVKPEESEMEAGRPQGAPATTETFHADATGWPESLRQQDPARVSLDRQLKSDNGVVVCYCDGTARSIANCLHCLDTLRTGQFGQRIREVDLSLLMTRCANEGNNKLYA